MRFMAAIFFALALFALAPPAWADITEIQAREVARNNNCTPKKVEIYQQTLGAEGRTSYRIECTMPKMADANAPKGADALLIGCRENLCHLIRPLTAEGK